jgi:hypothetical protein
VAKRYGATVVACPPRRGIRKGSVKKSIYFATLRCWRTMTAETMAQGQQQLDRFCDRVDDCRPRPLAKLEDIVGRDAAQSFLLARGHRRPTVGDLAELERLGPARGVLPGHHRSHQPGGSLAYSVPPGPIGADMLLRHWLGTRASRLPRRRGSSSPATTARRRAMAT